jgi:hypothetical protein
MFTLNFVPLSPILFPESTERNLRNKWISHSVCMHRHVPLSACLSVLKDASCLLLHV